jgi:hypothetical protein
LKKTYAGRFYWHQCSYEFGYVFKIYCFSAHAHFENNFLPRTNWHIVKAHRANAAKANLAKESFFSELFKMT